MRSTTSVDQSISPVGFGSTFKGDAARLVRQAPRAGIGVEMVRVWTTADHKLERALKLRMPKSYCPKCRDQPEPVGEELRLLLAALQPNKG